MRIVDKCDPVRTEKRPKIVTNNIKECLNPKEMDPIEELKLDIRKFLINKGNKNDEIGKTWYIRPNLPPNIDPTFHTFGKACHYSDPAGDIIYGEYIHYVDADPKFERIPGLQTNRNYKKPFDKNSNFGQVLGVDRYGKRVKQLLYCYEEAPEDCECDDKPKQSYSLQRAIVPRDLIDPTYQGVAAQLKECTMDPKLFKRNLCIAHLNRLRRQIRKRDDQVDFFNIRSHLCCINRRNGNPSSCLTSLDTFYDVLKLVRIVPDKELFEYILKDLNFIAENGEVYFPKALNILDWRHEFPILSKIPSLPDECLNYDSVYKKSMMPCEAPGKLCSFTTPFAPKDKDPEHDGVRKLIKACPMNPTVFQQKLCRAHLNRVRLQIIKRSDQVDFDKLIKDLKRENLGKDHPNLIPLDHFYEVLKSVKINPDREMFVFILKDLGLISKNCEVCYEDALKVLDWRYKPPELSFVRELPEDCVNYETAYSESMVSYGIQPVRGSLKREGAIVFPDK